MNAKSSDNGQRRTATVRHKTAESPKQTKDLSSTMQIPEEALFEDLPVERATHLDITCPDCEPRRIKLNDDTLVIGRDTECDIPLKLTNVSRQHAKVTYNGDEYTVMDLESTNGVFVNNIRINRCILRNQDLIRIGESKILFVREKRRG